MRPSSALRLVRVAHTIVWAFLAGIILAIPVVAWQRRFSLVLGFSALVFAEAVVLVLNDMRCPLTTVAARYTDDRSDNFDIYLPLWLARYNKQIFGTLFVAGVLLALFRWLE